MGKDIELLINILRLIITGIYLGILFFVKHKLVEYIEITGQKGVDINQEKEKNNNLWITLISGLIVLICESGLNILIRALSISANTSIGLYEEGTQNEFESRIAINYIIDIAIIVLHSISICFVQRIKQGIKEYQPSQPPAIIVQPPPLAVINVNKKVTIEQNEVIIASNQHPLDFY